MPRLVSRPAVEIVTAMQAFRVGQRPATVIIPASASLCAVIEASITRCA
jgi:cytochrome c553